MPTYYFIENGHLESSKRPPVGLMPFTHIDAMVQIPSAEALHRGLHAWDEAGFSPGPITPQSLFLGAGDDVARVALLFADGHGPAPLTTIPGAAKDRAAWLVLLDKTMPTAAVITSATTVWSHGELVTTLPFVTPVFLPAALVRYPPENWERVARALAALAAGA